MKLNAEEKQYLEDLYLRYLSDEKILQMKDIPMHRGSNCYIHSFRVARLAIKRALRHKQVNLEALLLACILHDYYLYNWRVDRSKKKGHGRNHPYIAAEQAERDFAIDMETKHAIQTHMWPLNFRDWPNTKEARILSLADKHIATLEFFTSSSYKKKREAKYLKEISSLFERNR